MPSSVKRDDVMRIEDPALSGGKRLKFDDGIWFEDVELRNEGED